MRIEVEQNFNLVYDGRERRSADLLAEDFMNKKQLESKDFHIRKVEELLVEMYLMGIEAGVRETLNQHEWRFGRRTVAVKGRL